MRTSNHKVNPSLKNQIQKTLAKLITELNKLPESESFLSSFFTDSEYETFAKRLAIAYWLNKGRPYANIRENLKVSSATIASVQSLMSQPGFKLALKKLNAEEWANLWSEKIKRFVSK